MQEPVNIIFLHHSTGKMIWRGATNKYLFKLGMKGQVQQWFDSFNKKNATNLVIDHQFFPKAEPYGWKNYPVDYYRLWVKNEAQSLYPSEPSLEMLTQKYQVVIFKHCFPVSNILPDTGFPDIESEDKRLENYKLQYGQLKEKLYHFPNTKFIVWTNPALVQSVTDAGQAQRAKDFHDWLVQEWQETHDNIYLFDFYALETESELYLKQDYAAGSEDSHPNGKFSKMASPIFCQRIVDIVLKDKH